MTDLGPRPLKQTKIFSMSCGLNLKRSLSVLKACNAMN